MLVGAVIQLLVALVQPLVELLPTSTLTLPDPSGIGGGLADLDTLLPVLAPLQFCAVLLLGLAAFIGLRLLLLLRYVLLP